MKKYFALLSLVLFAIVAMAQERTVNNARTQFKTDETFLTYTATAADTLKETNQDTIDFVFTNLNQWAIEKIVFTLSLDTIAGNDSIFYSIYGFNDLATTGVSITSGGLLVNESNDEFDIVKWYWTNATTCVDLTYRYYRLRFIQASNNSYDGGAKFDYIKGKIVFK